MANITEIRTLLETSFGLPPETAPDAELFSSQEKIEATIQRLKA